VSSKWVMYNTLIRGCLCNNEVTQAVQVIDVMAANSFQADSETTSSVLDLVSDE